MLLEAVEFEAAIVGWQEQASASAVGRQKWAGVDYVEEH
jgi:hypothetical protein